METLKIKRLDLFRKPILSIWPRYLLLVMTISLPQYSATQALAASDLKLKTRSHLDGDCRTTGVQNANSPSCLNGGFSNVVFTENSHRRLPNREEQKKFAAVDRSCSGFFIKNQNDELLFATASHCKKYDFTNACLRRPGVSIDMTEGFGEGVIFSHIGNCEKVLIEDRDADFVVMKIRADYPDALKKWVHFLTLSKKVPPAGTKLVELGFPGDPKANGAPTVTDNCWIIDAKGPTWPRFSAWGSSDVEKQTIVVFNTVAHEYENCSVYGGNSGGPILIEGTDMVIGMPVNYHEGDFELRPAGSEINFLNSASTFINRNRAACDKLGIVIDEP